ncbi:unnamed protein product [Cladocopium goreaui]|uniref:Voltage-dependent calcium channel type A subunit alpha-1 n=1 Tax=Cladocopium goreaui TaxID=2562237 RepID=A0A9P1CFH6_9DINO|nr:unnamed protein product [Cladocopium goreaui]
MPAPALRKDTHVEGGAQGHSFQVCAEGETVDGVDGSPVTPQQRFVDANDLFEGHLAGLVKAFQLLQQQSYELLQEANPGVGWTPTTCCSLAKSPSEPRFATSRLLDSWQSSRSSKTGDFARDITPREASKPKKALTNTDMEERSIKEQFDRLKDESSSMLGVETLVRLLFTYHPDLEFEDLQEMVNILVLGTDSLITPEDDPNRAPRRLRSHVASFSGDILAVKLDYTAFRRLRCEHELPVSSKNVLRDVAKARAALRSEELHTQFTDEPVEEEKVYYVFSARTSKLLELLPATVIVLNSLSFAFQEVFPGDDMWEIVENCFMVFYLMEATVKLRLMGCKGYFRGPEWAWNWFDLFCLSTSLLDFGVTQGVRAAGASQSVDLSILMLLKMLRLARLARLIRALRYPIFRELNLMVMGVVSGMRVLIWAIFLLIVFIYVVALAMCRLVGDTEQEFETLMVSMLTLFRCFTDGCAAFDGTPLQDRLLRHYGWRFFIGYILVFMLVTVGIFNLIMAIFIDNVMTTQLERKQRDLSETASDTEVALKDNLCRLLLLSKTQLVPTTIAEEIRSIGEANLSHKAKVRAQFDCLLDTDVVISRDAFRVWLQDREFLRVLEDADIDIHNKSTLFDLMDADMGGSLSTDEVYNGLMQLRGPPTKGDIVGISLRVTHIARLVQESIKDL